MKKVVAFLAALGLIISLPVSASAIDIDNTPSMELKTNQEYGFSYTEFINDEGSVVRTYRKEILAPSSVAYNDSSVNALTHNPNIKAILSTLGMEDEFVNELSDEELTEYSKCSQITSVVTYSKIDESGNIINISEDEALLATTGGPTNDMIIIGGGSGDSVSTSYRDSYMRLNLVISYHGNGKYKFSVDATWLTDPSCRLEDSLGACAQNFAIENGTRSGWYKYDQKNGLGNTESEYKDQKVTLTDFQNAEGLGNWDGSAVMFDLKDNFVNADDTRYYTIYRNHRVHYEFKATIHQWTITTNFNATATYDHAYVGVQLSPSITISGSGTSVSIGLNLVGLKDRYTAEFDSSIQHKP